MKQRNKWTILLIILVALLLPACTVSKKTETETGTKEDSVKSEENTVKGEENVQSESASNQLTVLEHTQQFGDDSFTDIGTVKDIGYLSVYEEGSTVYVCWMLGDKLYLSVAEDGNWLFKDKELFEDSSEKRTSLINGKSIYFVNYNYKEERVIGYTKANYNKNGSLSDERLIHTLDLKSSFPKTAPIMSTKGAGIIIKDSYERQSALVANPDDMIHTIILENDPNNPISFEDKYGLLQRSPGDFHNSNFFADFENNQLYFSVASGGLYLNVHKLDLLTEDPLYDHEGKDKTSKGTGIILIADDETGVYIGSASYRHYKGFTIAKYDQNLDRVSEEVWVDLTTNQQDYLVEQGIKSTITDDEIHIWNLIEFKRKPSLELFKISKIK
jgi:hypothetical protein